MKKSESSDFMIKSHSPAYILGGTVLFYDVCGFHHQTSDNYSDFVIKHKIKSKIILLKT